MEPTNKKQRTAEGVSPGVGSTEAVSQPLVHKPKSSDFELPVASIVRLVKRVSSRFTEGV